MTRSLKRFFISQIPSDGTNKLVLSKSETHHLERVLRLKPDDECVVFDSAGHEWRSKIVSAGKNQPVELQLVESFPSSSVKASRLVVAQAIPQRAKMDTIVEKAAEIGISRLIPIVTERTIVRIKRDDEAQVLNRWMSIVQETRKQSHSRVATEVLAPKPFREVLSEIETDASIYLFDPRAEKTLPEILSNFKRSAKRSIYLFIGPEGGFSKVEYDFAVQRGAIVVKLGDTILKTDTAFVTIASVFALYLS